MIISIDAPIVILSINTNKESKSKNREKAIIGAQIESISDD